MKSIQFFALFLLFFSCESISTKGVLNNTINASVIDKKIDTFNHYTHVFYFSDNTSGAIDVYMRHDQTLFNYVKIGDSISKNKGEYSLFVYKSDGIVKEFKYMDRNGNIYNNITYDSPQQIKIKQN